MLFFIWSIATLFYFSVPLAGSRGWVGTATTCFSALEDWPSSLVVARLVEAAGLSELDGAVRSF